MQILISLRKLQLGTMANSFGHSSSLDNFAKIITKFYYYLTEALFVKQYTYIHTYISPQNLYVGMTGQKGMISNKNQKIQNVKPINISVATSSLHCVIVIVPTINQFRGC